METLLRNDFIAHYGLPVSTVTDISISTSATYFEIEDDIHRETQLHLVAGGGVAAYNNNSAYTVTIINYDKFITSLPHTFQHGKKRCDLIVHTTNQRYFLLNELKDRKPREQVRTKSISQLLASLNLIMAVPTIAVFASSHIFRHCCFFNKQAMSPPTIIATAAFNRIGTLTTGGFRMTHPQIEALGFELWEYTGNQTYSM